MDPESSKRYEAVLYTVDGVHSMAFFDDSQPAHDWAVKQYGERSRVREAAAAVYDQEQNRKRIFVLDPQCIIPKT